MNQLYCIKHEAMFKAQHDVFWGLSHTCVEPVKADLWGNGTDYGLVTCDFPMGFANCAPPVFADVEREPYQEELEEAEQGAQEFLLTLEEA